MAIIPFVQQLDSIAVLENGLRALGEESPEKAYLLAIAIDKVASNAKKEHSEAFKKFYDSQKELPGGFSCTVRQGGKVYAFEENPEWAELKAKMDALEEKLKLASDLKLKGATYVDTDTGEIVDGVNVSWKATSYAVTRK